MDLSASTPRSRLWVIASLMIGAVSLTAIVFNSMGRGSVENSAHASLTSTIDEKTVALNAKPRTVELTSEKAMRVRNAIKQGDYPTAGKIVADVVANSRLENWRYYPFGTFITGIPAVNDPQFEANLNAWVAQNNNDAIPLLVRAQYSHDVGWFKRGGKFTGETLAAQLDSFQKHMNEALADADASIQLNDGNPYSFYLRLKILRDLGISDRTMTAFDEAIAKYPTYYPLYDLMLGTLEPKWGGSIPKMYAFVDRYAGQAQEHSPLKLLYLSLYRRLLGTASIACTPHGSDKDKMAQCVASALQNIVTPGFGDQLRVALDLYDHSDNYQFGIAVEGILSDMSETGSTELYSGAILQLAAMSMHSDTQLKEDEPGRNNYVIDKAVAESWYRKGFYDNALKKNLEALKAVEATAFPGEEGKLLAISGIYENIASTYERLNQYPDMIAYEKAAVAVGGKTGHEHLVCYGYYKLKDYDGAVRACTEALEHQAGNSPARYWRGVAYREMGQTDAALQDLRTVADLDGSFRTSAAIDMSMIYFNRNDNRSALDLFNKYQFLYDPNATSKANMAVAYNNRCYAYMQLGSLHEALDDCRASLKYGNIPDAYRKLQQLIERLGADVTRM
jgi:tetratricopeptide (TPR) repeat protein